MTARKKVIIPMITNNGEFRSISAVDLTALLCYAKPEESEFASLLTNEQTSVLIDSINNEIISKLTQTVNLYLFRVWEQGSW